MATSYFRAQTQWDKVDCKASKLTNLLTKALKEVTSKEFISTRNWSYLKAFETRRRHSHVSNDYPYQLEYKYNFNLNIKYTMHYMFSIYNRYNIIQIYVAYMYIYIYIYI